MEGGGVASPAVQTTLGSAHANEARPRLFYFQSSDKCWKEINLGTGGFPSCLFFHCKYLYITNQMTEGTGFCKNVLLVT